MTALPQDNMPTLDEAALTGPGQRLAEARKAANLGIADVAARLHLDARTIEALERDEYQGLPAPAFVRGYLRGYARLLNLPAEPIIDAYNRDGHAPPALVADIGRNSQGQAASSDLPVRLVTYLIAAGLVALVVVWWRNQSIDPLSMLELGSGRSALPLRPTVSPSAAANTKVIPAPGTAATRGTGSTHATPAAGAGATHPPASATAATSTGGEPAAPPPATTPPSGQASASTAQATTGAPATTPATAVAGAPATSGARIKAKPLAPAAASGAKPAAPAAAHTGLTAAAHASAVTAPAAAIGRLNLSFQHDSWVEVYSAKGDRLFFGMAHAGHQIAVQGQPPLQVLLGYARDIRVEYNGALLNYEPFVTRGIARFTIGKDGTPEASAAASGGASSQ